MNYKNVDALAQKIRSIPGWNNMGAARLAEALFPLLFDLKGTSPLPDYQLDNLWLMRDCIGAIQDGDMLAQFRSVARQVEAIHGITE